MAASDPERTLTAKAVVPGAESRQRPDLQRPSHSRRMALAATGEARGMDSVELTLERALFSNEVLARTAYRYTDDYYVDLQGDAEVIRVRLVPRHADLDIADVALRFRNDALDDRLRAVVAAHTSDIQAALIQAALTEAWPRGRSGV